MARLAGGGGPPLSPSSGTSSAACPSELSFDFDATDPTHGSRSPLTDAGSAAYSAAGGAAAPPRGGGSQRLIAAVDFVRC
eukprot:gene8427-16745_t